MPVYADIAFATAVRQPFTYALPEELRAKAAVGKRAWVPLRKQKAIGFIVNIHKEKPDFNTRPIEKVLDDEPVLSGELLKLTHWMHRFYYCSWGEAIQAALPVGLNFYSEKKLHAVGNEVPHHLDKEKSEIVGAIREDDSYPLKEANKRWGNTLIQQLVGQKLLEVWEEPAVKMKPNTETVWEWAGSKGEEEAYKLVKEYQSSGKEYKWVRALELLLELGLPDFQNELTVHELLEYYTLNRIAEEGLIASREVEASNLSLKHTHDPSQLKTLNAEQQKAYQAIDTALGNEDFTSFLLHGITGSGKTEVYIHALKKIVEKGKGGLVLVPEIGLTPQIVKRFYTIFGDNIAVLHSRLSNRERYEAWRALQQGEKRIAIGARSAVFAPVQNLGLIVVDEEHDSSYKAKKLPPPVITDEMWPSCERILIRCR